MKWILCGDEYDDALSLANEITENMDDCFFYDYIRDTWGDAIICGHQYDMAYAMRKVDPIMMQIMEAEYKDEIAREIALGLNLMTGGWKNFYGFTVECKTEE